MDCIFCKIISQEIPGDIIYANDAVVAFMDIKPVKPGHTLVVARQHFPDLLHTPPEVLSAMIANVPKIAAAVLSATGAPAFIFSTNNGQEAGQIIPHLHWHLIPRHTADGLAHWAHTETPAAEITALAEKIKAAL